MHAACDEPGAVCQDPRFIGGDGLTFYFHGKKDKNFCLLSDPNLHINAHFIGKRNPLMKRDFTWVQSLGLLFGKHQIYVGATKAAAWDDSDDRLALSVDGEPVLLPTHLGATWHSSSMPGLSITRTRDANGVAVELEGTFKIEANVVPITKEESRVHGYGVTDDDCMAHLNLGFKFYALTDDVSGVLGQTYGKNYVSRMKMGVAMAVMGGEKEFAASSIFAPDCAASRFVGSSSAVVINNVEIDFADLQCSSRMSGAGVVCKR